MSFRWEKLAVQQALRYFHNDIAGRHVIVYSDCKALCHAFKSSTSQDLEPLVKAHLLVIRQWTRDIQAKDNMMADFLSRAHTVRKNYVAKSADPDLEAAIHEINIDKLEMVSLQTLSPKALADAQALCSPMPCHKNGNKPKSIKMGYHTINTSNCFVKFHKTNGP